MFLFSFLALTLLMLRVDADHPDHAMALQQLALFTNLFDRRANLHGSPFLFHPGGDAPDLSALPPDIQ